MRILSFSSLLLLCVASIRPSTSFSINSFQSKQRIQTDERSTLRLGATLDQQPSRTPSTSRSTSGDFRTIDRIEKFARLPVWPVANGVILFILSKLFGDETAAKLEDAIGGRVCPNFFQNFGATSPFVMLVHHRHSFFSFDPFRFISSIVLPEGFPSHPHRGFVTVTYILKGGFVHRDSLGIKQTYGAEERHEGKHTQWLTTGGGILHEEMFDNDESTSMWCDQELYQLWLNLPSDQKLSSPRIDLLGGEESTPTVIATENGSKTTRTIVIAGEHDGKSSTAPIQSSTAILHVQIDGSGATWRHVLPAEQETAIIYVRKGAISIQGQRVPAHSTAYLSTRGSDLVVDSDEGADFLLLAGEPLREPVVAQGSMVMNTNSEIQMAYQDYSMGKMGLPWSEKLKDDEWQAHVRQHPSIYTVEGSYSQSQRRSMLDADWSG